MWCMTQYSHRTFSPTSLHEFSHTPFHENHVCIVSSIREDVKGVAGVALATPFFPDLFYMPSRLLAIRSSGHRPSNYLVIRPSGYLVIQTSGHLVIRPSGHPTIRSSDHSVIWSSRLLAIWSSDHLVIQTSGHPTIWSSVSMPEKCPYWDIFGLPSCRLHQSQIPNVLPASFPPLFSDGKVKILVML